MELSAAALRVFRACPHPHNNSIREGAHTCIHTCKVCIHVCVHANRHLNVKRKKSVNVERLKSEEGVMKFQVREEQRI